MEGELKQVSEFPVRAVSELPAWARGLKLSETDAAVQSYINGDGVTFQFVLVVANAHVRALFVNAELEGG